MRLKQTVPLSQTLPSAVVFYGKELHALCIVSEAFSFICITGSIL